MKIKLTSIDDNVGADVVVKLQGSRKKVEGLEGEQIAEDQSYE
jgi:uncharacterized protein Veg